MNAPFDLLAWNRPANDLFGYGALRPPLNLLELLLFEGPVAGRFADRTATLLQYGRATARKDCARRR